MKLPSALPTLQRIERQQYAATVAAMLAVLIVLAALFIFVSICIGHI